MRQSVPYSSMRNNAGNAAEIAIVRHGSQFAGPADKRCFAQRLQKSKSKASAVAPETAERISSVAALSTVFAMQTR